jgi:hypothetical protein
MAGARFDKYDPVSGGFRAALGFAPAPADKGVPIAITLNGSGRVIKSVDGTTARGVICMDETLAQGDIVDCMTDGEIVDITSAMIASGGAGVTVKAGATGAIAGGAGAGVSVGWFVEPWRLVVRMGRL